MVHKKIITISILCMIHIYQPIQSSILIPNYNLVNNFLKITDKKLEESRIFWNAHQAAFIDILDNKESTLRHNKFPMIMDAIRIGEDLQQNLLLSIFDSQYNLLAAALEKITWIETIPDYELKQLKTDANSLVTSLDQQASRKNQPRIKPMLPVNGIDTIKRVSKKETVHQYLKQRSNRNILAENLRGYEFIRDVRGDGNCGYRAFITSACMHAIASHNYSAIEQFKQLIDTNFMNLFTQYAENESNHLYKLSIDEDKLAMNLNEIHNTQNYLLEKLTDLQKSHNIEDVRIIMNDPIFDFYMIMFLRTLIADYMLDIHNYERLMNAAAARYLETDKYIDNLLQWGRLKNAIRMYKMHATFTLPHLEQTLEILNFATM